MAYKIVPGFEKYVVFDDGRVWSRTKHLFMKASLTIDGYPQTMFNRKSLKIHRLIAMAFHPNPQGLKEVNHKDGNKINNHYKNLEWSTRSHNIKQNYKLGIMSGKGSKNGNAKLTDDQVKEIRYIYKQGVETQKSLGKKFGVSQTHIGYIVNNKSWV